MGSVFATLLAIIKAVPIVESWIEQFVAFYTAARISAMKKENREAVRRAVLEHDQRELEKAAGNPNPGEPSNAPGSEIIPDRPPGVDS